MPDGDVFERKLFGKGWKRAYRGAIGKIDFNDLVSLLNNAKDEALRNGLSCPVIDDISGLVFESLKQPLFSPVDVYRQLSLRLDALAVLQTSFPGTRIAIDAAKRLYTELSSGKRPIAKEEVRQIDVLSHRGGCDPHRISFCGKVNGLDRENEGNRS